MSETTNSVGRFIDLVRSSYDDREDRQRLGEAQRKLHDYAFEKASAEMAEMADRLARKNAELNEALESLMRREGIESLNAELASKNDALRRALQSEMRTQSMFETLVDSSPHAILYTDEFGRVQYVNRQSELTLRAASSELDGFGWLRWFGTNERNQLRTLLTEQNTDRLLLEHPISWPDGAIRWVSTIVAAIRNDDRCVGWIVNLEDITDRKANEAELARLAQTDELTKLLNRRSFGSALSHLIDTATGDQRVAVGLIDLDRFKLVNDTFGHQAGDQLLVFVAGILRGLATSADVIARLGGDEFSFARLVRSEDEAEQFVIDLVDELHQPVWVDNHLVHAGGSVGLVVADPGDVDADSLLRDADTAMYRAKADRSRRYCLFDQRFREEVTRRFVLERELHDAIEEDRIDLVFQPIVDVVAGRTHAIEALARWRSDALGPVSPVEFVPAAEHLGMSRMLGSRILTKAIAQLREWRSLSPQLDDLAVSVNITYSQLIAVDFVDEVLALLAENELPCSSLILELVESDVLSDFDRATEVLDRLRATGIRLAIDDFGTGYSALSYLARLELDYLKIDKSFIHQLSNDETADGRLTETIVDLARRFGLRPVAEGVETAAQRDRLGQLGCTLLQGYFLAEPMRGDDPNALAVLTLGSDGDNREMPAAA